MPIAAFQPQVRFVLPPDQGGGTLSVDAAASSSELDRRAERHLDQRRLRGRNWPSAARARSITRHFAVNVDPREGNARAARFGRNWPTG